GGEVDKAELPSALMPAGAGAGAPAEERPVTKGVGPVQAMRQQWSQSWKLVGAAALVALGAPVLAVGLLLGRGGGLGSEGGAGRRCGRGCGFRGGRGSWKRRVRRARRPGRSRRRARCPQPRRAPPR